MSFVLFFTRHHHWARGCFYVIGKKVPSRQPPGCRRSSLVYRQTIRARESSFAYFSLEKSSLAAGSRGAVVVATTVAPAVASATIAASAAAPAVAATAAGASAPAVVSAAAPDDDQQNDDPAAVSVAKTVIAHDETS